MPGPKPNFFPQPFDWIPGVWCIMCYQYFENTVGLYMYFERGRAKLFHTHDEALAYAKQL